MTKKLLGVFAHPDDDVIIGPLLAHCANRGVAVQLAYLTSGQAGENLIGPESGEALGALREKEARTASRAYGILEPLFLRAQDGTLPALTPQAAQTLEKRLMMIMDDLRPDVVLTFGPDGYTRHGDHKATCSMMTDLLQRGLPESISPRLYYVALPEHAAKALAAGGFPDRALAWTRDRYITTQINASDGLEAAMAALHAYPSQFSPADREMLQRVIREALADRITLRCALPPAEPSERERHLF